MVAKRPCLMYVPISFVDAYDTLFEGGVEKSQGILPFSCIAHTCHVALSHFAYAPCIFGSSAVEKERALSFGCILVLYR